jgi:hypothetical protein
MFDFHLSVLLLPQGELRVLDLPRLLQFKMFSNNYHKGELRPEEKTEGGGVKSQ